MEVVAADAAAASSRGVDARGSRGDGRRADGRDRRTDHPRPASDVPSCWSSALTSVRRSTEWRTAATGRGLSIGASVLQNARHRQTLRLTT